MWIDSHCHLDAAEFAGSTGSILNAALKARVTRLVLPAVDRPDWGAVTALAQRHGACFYGLGIHPMYVPNAIDADLALLRAQVEMALMDRKFVAIGEIGLDFFEPALCVEPMRSRQIFFFQEQLRIARDYDLPVLLHVRRSQDECLKHLRRIGPAGGFAHAFNGSSQQADGFIEMGFKLGFGGAMTFMRATRIRTLAKELPMESIVLETDAPDIAPAWLRSKTNRPDQLPGIGVVLADLRGMDVETIAQTTSANVCAVLPRLAD